MKRMILAPLAMACFGVVDGRAQSAPSIDSVLAVEDARPATRDSLGPILAALGAADATIRQQAVRALGRLEQPALLPDIAPLLTDTDAEVRREALNALGQAVFDGAPDLTLSVLVRRLRLEEDPRVLATVARTIGRLPFTNAGALDRAERALLEAAGTNAAPAPTETLVGVAHGFASLIRRNAQNYTPSVLVLPRLRAMAGTPGTGDAVLTRRLATAAVIAAGGATAAFLDPALDDPDTEVRRRAARALRAPQPLSRRRALIEKALADTTFQVRFEALGAYGRHLRAELGCGVLYTALQDGNAHVRLAAVGLLRQGCPDDVAGVVDTLARFAQTLPAGEGDDWHLAAHALASLSALAPARAASLLDPFVTHPSPFVRTYAATAAEGAQAEPVLRRLARDAHPIVRERAIQGLARTVGPAAFDAYLEALQSDDYQLIRTATLIVRTMPDTAAAIDPMTRALARLTDQRRETSRDPRVALLTVLREFGAPAETFEAYLIDFDPAVAGLAADILTESTGADRTAAPAPLAPTPVPSVDEIDRWDGARAVFAMRGGGRFEIVLYAEEAPTNVARFVRLIESGYFAGLTFHRVVPLFVVQGGSPGGNEYMGDGPFTRDELGLRSHLRGTVGISTRGRDTGDGQIFVNLVDNYRLDHNYTIIGEVVAGMDVVDDLLEGATIERVTLASR